MIRTTKPWAHVCLLRRSRLAGRGIHLQFQVLSKFCHLPRFNLFRGCPKSQPCTIILHGGAEQFMEENERSLHDPLMLCPYLCCLRHHWLSGLRYWDMHCIERILYLISSGVLCRHGSYWHGTFQVGNIFNSDILNKFRQKHADNYKASV